MNTIILKSGINRLLSVKEVTPDFTNIARIRLPYHNEPCKQTIPILFKGHYYYIGAYTY